MKKMNTKLMLKILGEGMVIVGTIITAVVTGNESTKEIVKTVAKLRGAKK